jgi:hypothetical protein
MQDNKYISRDVMNTLIQNNKVTDNELADFFSGISAKGYKIEGYNGQPKPVEKTLNNSLKQRVADLASSISDVQINMEQAQSLPEVGKTLGRGLLRTGGAVAGGVMDTVGAGIGAVAQGADNVLGNLPSNAIKAGGEAFLATETGKKALASLQQSAVAFEEYKKTNPEGARDLENAIDIANIFPTAKGVFSLAKGAAETGKLLAKAGQTGLTVGSKGVKATGERLYSSAFTPNVKEAENILAYEASKPAGISRIYGAGALEGNPAFKPITASETGLRSGIAGTEKQVGVQAKRVADTLYNKEISPAVNSIEGTISKDDLFNPLKKNISSITDPSKKKAYELALAALEDDYKDVTNYTFKEAQKLKSEIAEFTPAKVFRGQDVANETRMLQADIASTIRQKTYESLKDVNIKQKYIDYGNLQELQKVGIKAISEAKLKGGFGGFWTSVYDTAMTPFKTVGGKVIYRIGNALEVKAPKGFEGKPLSEYLKAIGYLAPVVAQEQASN